MADLFSKENNKIGDWLIKLLLLLKYIGSSDFKYSLFSTSWCGQHCHVNGPQRSIKSSYMPSSVSSCADVPKGAWMYFLYCYFIFLGFLSFIDSNKQAVIYKAKALKQIQINSKGQP